MTPNTRTTPEAQELADAMRRAMTTIREWKDGMGSAGHAHAILYEALASQGLSVYEDQPEAGHAPGALPDCSPLLCGHPANESEARS